MNVLTEYTCFSLLAGNEEVRSRSIDFLTKDVLEVRHEPMGKIDLFFFQQFLDDTMKDGGFNLEHIKYTNLFNVSQDIHSDSAVLGSLLDRSLENSDVSRSASPSSFGDDDFSRSASRSSFDSYSEPSIES